MHDLTARHAPMNDRILTRALSKLQGGNTERHSDRKDGESLSLITSYNMVGQKNIDHPEAADSALKQNFE